MLRRTLFPSRYWKACDIERLRRPRRAAWYAVAALGVVLVVSAAARTAFALAVIWANGGFGWSDQRVMGVYISDNWISLSATSVNMVMPLRAVELTVLYTWVVGPRPTPAGIAVESVDWVVLLGVGAIPLTTAAVYRALPWTLGAARVRAAQIWRVLCYGVPVWLLVLEAAMLAWWMVIASGWWGLKLSLLTLGLAVAVLWQQWAWWLAVNREFLRLDRPRAITAAMVTISWLAGLVVVAGFSRTVPDLWQHAM